MEIFAIAIDAVSGEPVPYATVQRLYPGGEVYASPVVADGQGKFNGRVPDTSYLWDVTSAGYQPIRVYLTDAKDNVPSDLFVVQMYRNDVLPEVVVTPQSSDEAAPKKNHAVAWIAAIAAVAYVAKKQRWI
jgi:hypothetical protein